MEDEQKNKAHKGKTVGNKAAKKDALKKKRSGIDLEPNRGSNLKAFQGPSSGSHKGQKFLRSVEKRESALHLPTVDKTLRHIVAEPPLLVAVVGPPGVGKSTLIRSMVKFYSNRNLQSVRGPITVVAGKTRRLTFIECPNTLSAMCDVAKTADLILLMVDGNFGFEMETFEFLNIAQVHGFPKMFGIVSHLDQLKTGKALKKRKKFLRHRFWHEVAAGAKIMCLAPMIHSLYRPTDVLNLHRLLICVEPKIQAWRNTHSCILMDRHEDITNPDVVAADNNCNRSIAFYGYARGRPIKTGQLVHIPGLGDFPIHHLSHQDDPCQVDGFGDLKSQGHRMRHLSMKQKKLYAPYCDVGGITYDDDAIYVQQDAEMGAIQRSGEGVELLHELQRAEPMDVSAARLEVMRRPVVFRHEDTMELEMDEVRAPSNSSSEEDDDEDYDDEPARAGQPSLADFGEREESGEEDANEDDDGTLAPRLRNAADSIRLSVPHHAWMDGEEANMSLVRMLKDLCVTGKWAEDGDAPDAEEDGEAVDENSKGYESDDEDFEAEARGTKPLSCHSDGAEEGPSPSDDDDDDDESNDGERADATVARRHDALAGLSHSGSRSGGDASSWSAFMAPGGSSSSAARRTRTAKDDEDDDYNILDDDEDEDGEGGEVSGAPRRAADEDEELNDLVSGFLNNTTEGSGKTKEEDAIRFYDPNARRQAAVDDGDEVEEAVANQDTLTEEQEKLLQRKMAKKAAFDEDYDAGTGKSMTYSHLNKLNRKAQEVKERIDDALRDVGEEVEQKIQLVGYFSGLYIRFVVQDVPVEFVRCFNPCTPLIAGGVNPGEDEYTIVHAKIKRHRWYPKVLKAQDPLLLSIGWRRIQTQPIFATDDPNGRCRYLKYSPLHMHCNAAFYAPVAPANTGFLAIPVRDQRTTNFRISCTGYTVGNDVTTDIVKKLKLTGTPAKIEKTTVFVKGMFNSDVEAAKFVGAKLKSVAGIRGIIKSVLKGKQGLVRATFEDKILPSDIVFIRAWKGVQPPKYCAMQRNLVDPEWVGMRTMRELRIDYGVPLPQNADSEYREIKRRHRGDEDAAASKKVLISRNMRMQLPFDMKEEYIPVARTSAMQERIQGAVTIVPERREQRRRALLDTFEDRADAMTRKKDEAKKRARVRAASEAAKENEVYLQGLKKAKKETARRAEFRSQHKSRSHGKSASSS